MLRGESRAAATSKLEHFVIIVNGFQPLSIITKRSIVDAAAVLDPPLRELDHITFKDNVPLMWKQFIFSFA